DHVPEFGNFDILDENRLAGLLSREHQRLELSKLGSQHWRPILLPPQRRCRRERTARPPAAQGDSVRGLLLAVQGDALAVSLPDLRTPDLGGGADEDADGAV